MATCKKGTMSWFCLYPDRCKHGGCKGCSSLCCDGGTCAHGCCYSASAVVTHGGCCWNTASASGWFYAWKSNSAYGIHLPCQAFADFTSKCSIYFGAYRADTGPAPASRIADMTQALFKEFASLGKGLIHSMRITTNAGCC